MSAITWQERSFLSTDLIKKHTLDAQVSCVLLVYVYSVFLSRILYLRLRCGIRTQWSLAPSRCKPVRGATMVILVVFVQAGLDHYHRVHYWVVYGLPSFHWLEAQLTLHNSLVGVHAST